MIGCYKKKIKTYIAYIYLLIYNLLLYTVNKNTKWNGYNFSMKTQII